MWFWFSLGVLATWRVTHLLAEEDGPADLVVQLRARLGDGAAGRALDCFHCLSVWVAAPVALLLAQDVATWLVVWLAMSGAACLLQRVTSNADSRAPGANPLAGDDPYVMLRSEAHGAAHGSASNSGISQPARRIAESDAAHVPR
jgi:hypothetical protein